MGPEPSQLEEDLRPYQELVASVGCFAVCYLALIPYFLHRKNANFIGSLLFFICACTYYSTIAAVEAVAWVLNTWNLLTANAILSNDDDGLLFFLFRTTSIDFVYVGSAVLALDRFLAITFPAKYSPSCSRILCFTALSVSLLTVVYVFGSFMLFPTASRGFTITTALVHIGVFYDSMAPIELALHVLFCVQYRRLLKRQTWTNQKTLKANQIAFVQGISQTVFCLCPKIAHRLNQKFFANKVAWIRRFTWYFQLFFALHVLFTCAFMVHKLRITRKPKVHIVHSSDR